MIDRISHYSFTNPASIHDEEALTALELAGRTAAKVNACIDEVNAIPETISKDVEKHITEGTFRKEFDDYTKEVTDAINESAKDNASNIADFKNTYNNELNQLETRFDNLLGNTTSGTSTLDAEIIDARVDANGNTLTNLGEHIRTLENGENFVAGAITLGKLDQSQNDSITYLDFSHETRKETGSWNYTSNRYCSRTLENKLMSIGDIVVCEDSNYKIWCRAFNEDGTVASGQTENWQNYFVIIPELITNNKTLNIYVKKNDNADINDGLERYFNNSVYIIKNPTKYRGFNRANFELSKVHMGKNNILLNDDLTTNSSDYHKFIMYYDTNGNIINDINMRFLMINKDNYPRFFIEDINGTAVFFNFGCLTDTIEINPYLLDKENNSFRIIGNTSTVSQPAPEKLNIRARVLNGVIAIYIDDFLVASFNLSSYLSEIVNCGLAYRGGLTNTSYCEKFEVSYRDNITKTHISFDDQISVLEDLTNNVGVYNSIFDNDMLSQLKTLHDTYNLTFTLNLFDVNAPTGSTGFSLSDVTDSYKAEFTANSNWLKFAYHSKNTDTYSSQLTDDELINNIKSVYSNIVRFAGVKSCDRFVRFGMFSANKTAINKAVQMGIINGCLTADDSRTSNVGLTDIEREVVNNCGEYIDYVNGVKYYKSMTRIDNATNHDELKRHNMNPSQINILFAHTLTTTSRANIIAAAEELKRHNNIYGYLN